MKLNGTGGLSGNGGPPPNMTVGMNGNISTNPGGALGPTAASMSAAAANGAGHLQHMQVGGGAAANHHTGAPPQYMMHNSQQAPPGAGSLMHSR